MTAWTKSTAVLTETVGKEWEQPACLSGTGRDLKAEIFPFWENEIAVGHLLPIGKEGPERTKGGLMLFIAVVKRNPSILPERLQLRKLSWRHLRPTGREWHRFTDLAEHLNKVMQEKETKQRKSTGRYRCCNASTCEKWRLGGTVPWM